jgi:hypothetical protein
MLEFAAHNPYTHAMSDEPDNLVLRYLRRIDEKLDRLIDEVVDLKHRIGVLEERTANVERRLDRVDARLDRIERRFDLIDHVPA